MSTAEVLQSSVHTAPRAAVRAWLSLSGAYGARVTINTLAKVALGAMLTTWLTRGELTLWVLATSFAVVVAQIVDAGFQHIAVRASSVGLVTARSRRRHATQLLRVIARFAIPCTFLAAGLAVLANRFWLAADGFETSQVVVVFAAAMLGAFAQMAGTTLAAYLIGAGRPWVGVLCTGAAMLSWAFIAGVGAASHVALPIATIGAQVPFVLMIGVVWRLLGNERTDGPRSAAEQKTDSAVPRAANRDLVSFVLYNLAGFIITGVDVYVVAAVEPLRVAGYSYAVQATSLCYLLCAALANPLVAQTARRSSGAATAPGLGSVIRITRMVSSACVLFIVLGSLWFAQAATVWLGDVGHDAALVFVPLGLAACLRSLLVPPLLGAVGSGQLRVFVRPSLIEAAVNLVASIALGIRYGAVGVATGSLVGAVASLLMFRSTVRRWGARPEERVVLVRLALRAAVIVCTVAMVARGSHSMGGRIAGSLALTPMVAAWSGGLRSIRRSSRLGAALPMLRR